MNLTYEDLLAMLKECISEYKRGKGRLTTGEYPTDRSRNASNYERVKTMKKRITSLMLILVVAVSMTMGASAASYIPDDVTYQNLNGQQLAIKTYTLLPDQDPSDLYEDDFEYDGFLYSMSDIVKEEQRYQEENAHTEVVTVTTASKNLEDILAERNLRSSTMTESPPAHFR